MIIVEVTQIGNHITLRPLIRLCGLSGINGNYCRGGNHSILIVTRLIRDTTSRNGVVRNDIIHLAIEAKAKRVKRE